jgi:hypothetical protein
MDRYAFDTTLFPVNFVLFSQAKFGPQVLDKAQQKQMGMTGLIFLMQRQKGKRGEERGQYEEALLPSYSSAASLCRGSICSAVV